MLVINKIHNKLMIIEKIDNYIKLFNNLCENYRVQDAVFGLLRNNQITELKKGYFIAKKEYTDIRECVMDCIDNINTQAIRITEDKFILGDYYVFLNECPCSNDILDIEFYERIEH